MDILETEDEPSEKLAVDYSQILQEENLFECEDLVHNENKTIRTINKVENHSKTKVMLLINGDCNNVIWINILKSPNDVTLGDIKLILHSKPKKYGMSNEIMYEYSVKTTDEDGNTGFEDIDNDNTILPLFGKKIVLKCWA